MGQRIGLGFEFYFQILKYLLCIIPFGIIITGIGRWLLQILQLSTPTPNTIRTPISFTVGWSVFTLVLAIIGFFGWYNLPVFYGLLLASIAVSYREIWQAVSEFYAITFHVPNGKYGAIRFWINSILLVTLFVGISVNYANIVRPFPIGWDDLGVYMNYPKMMAFAESTAHQTIMMWQTFTGIGFLHQSATLAFFLNSFSGLLAILGIWAGIHFFSPKNNAIVSLPLLATTVFMSLPMIVFQQAKDMKLDAGLLGISIFSVIALFLAFGQKDRKTSTLFYLLAGGLMGVAFGIKFTTLMLIVSAFSIIFYNELGIFGFFGFVAMFVGIFTSFRLWDFMNVNYPRSFEHIFAFGAGLFVIGLLLCGVAAKLKKVLIPSLLNTLILPIVYILLGFMVTLGPWIVKNASEVGVGKITIATLLG